MPLTVWARCLHLEADAVTRTRAQASGGPVAASSSSCVRENVPVKDRSTVDQPRARLSVYGDVNERAKAATPRSPPAPHRVCGPGTASPCDPSCHDTTSPGEQGLTVPSRGGNFMHAGALDYAMHNYAQLCTIMHNYAKLCTTMRAALQRRHTGIANKREPGIAIPHKQTTQ